MLETQLLEDVPCNICGTSQSRVLLKPTYDPAAYDSDQLIRTFRSSSEARLNHRLVACGSCGLQYVSPRLRSDVVLEGYASGSDEAFVSQVRGRELTFSRCLQLIERDWRRPPGRLLDIGTGSGAFLHVAAQHGWQVDGCEPSRWLCDWAARHYGLEVKPGTVFDQAYPSASYDVVTLWDVLEHTADPRREIREMHRLLREQGLLVINYPDIGSWIARVMGRSWVFLLDVHLYYFTRATIRRLLEDAGFEIVRMRPHFQSLGLAYVLHRASASVGAPARWAAQLSRRAGIGEWQVPYWVGQTLVIARKTAAPGR